LALILGGADDLEVIGQAGDGSEAIELVSREKPAVVLMDIRMPVIDGIEATSRLVQLPGRPRVIVLTTFGADDYVLRALTAGAQGFLLKDTAPADIVDAIRRVASGEPILSPAVTGTLIEQVTRSPREPERVQQAR